MYNQDERDQERAEDEGLFAAVPNEEPEESVEEPRQAEPQEEPDENPGVPSDGEAQVRYVGAGGAYTDKDGTRYKKNEDVIVDEETASRLESVRGGSLFVRTAG